MSIIKQDFGELSGGNFTESEIGSANSLTTQTFDVSAILPDKYTSLTVDNFYIKNCRIAYVSGTATTQNYIIDSYNPSTGTLSCKNSAWSAGNYKFYIEYTIVAIYD